VEKYRKGPKASGRARTIDNSVREKVGNTVTQRDVAGLANVSQAAVSRVMANNGYVASEVRSRIEKAVRELGYRPDALARGLITGKSNIVAIVMANVVNPFYPIVLDAFTEELQRRGRQVLLFNAAHHQTVDDLIPAVLQYRVAGIIITTASLSTTATALCAARNVPVVLFNRYSKSENSNAVSCDNRLGGEQAATLLLSAGCKKLAYIGGFPDSSTNMDRRTGFIKFARKNGVRPVAIEERAFSYEWGAAAMTSIISRHPGVDGVFCADDVIAFGALDALRYHHNKRVPRDVSVIGFDDVPSASWSAYQLTTIRQPLEAMVEKTLALIEAPDDVDRSLHLVPGEMILRKTVRVAGKRKDSVSRPTSVNQK
jgi:DNA-binding LacI/PurR family transcriptional regulator